MQGDPAGVPTLLISGPADELTNQTRLLSSDLSRLALGSKAVVGPLKSTPQLPGNLTTLRELGQPGVNAVALAPQVLIGLDQTIGRADPRTGCGYTYGFLYARVPPSIRAAQLVASVGGETIDRWSADANGVIDRWVTSPTGSCSATPVWPSR